MFGQRKAPDQSVRTTKKAARGKGSQSAPLSVLFHGVFGFGFAADKKTVIAFAPVADHIFAAGQLRHETPIERGSHLVLETIAATAGNQVWDPPFEIGQYSENKTLDETKVQFTVTLPQPTSLSCASWFDIAEVYPDHKMFAGRDGEAVNSNQKVVKSAMLTLFRYNIDGATAVLKMTDSSGRPSAPWSSDVQGSKTLHVFSDAIFPVSREHVMSAFSMMSAAARCDIKLADAREPMKTYYDCRLPAGVTPWDLAGLRGPVQGQSPCANRDGRAPAPVICEASQLFVRGLSAA
jgi:hypothetical protein